MFVRFGLVRILNMQQHSTNNAMTSKVYLVDSSIRSEGEGIKQKQNELEQLL